jgi:hypothetical protein
VRITAIYDIETLLRAALPPLVLLMFVALPPPFIIAALAIAAPYPFVASAFRQTEEAER